MAVVGIIKGVCHRCGERKTKKDVLVDENSLVGAGEKREFCIAKSFCGRAREKERRSSPGEISTS